MPTQKACSGVTILTTVGVRQGSPTSCLLFVVFVDELIRMIKARCGMDGFLQWLHTLVLMDDTVLLATTKCNMVTKIILLQDYCEEYGMRINQLKTKFFVIGGKEGDSEPLVVNGLTVEHCQTYVYLGSVFTSDGSVSSAVIAHASAKMSHALKFVSFINKNNNVPFVVKKRVFDAALMSTLLYECVSWVGADVKPMIKLYNWCLKRLLGVRKSTCNDVIYIESGYPPLQDFIKYRQHKFFYTMWQERRGYNDDPLVFIMNLIMNSQTCTGHAIRTFVTENVTPLGETMIRVSNALRQSESSRRMTYQLINPDMTVHYVYRERHVIDEFHRLSFTKMCVSGHCLACETGRWNRHGRGRLPLEERVC